MLPAFTKITVTLSFPPASFAPSTSDCATLPIGSTATHSKVLAIASSVSIFVKPSEQIKNKSPVATSTGVFSSSTFSFKPTHLRSSF